MGHHDRRQGRQVAPEGPFELGDGEIHVWSLSLGEVGRGQRRAAARQRRTELLCSYLGQPASELSLGEADGGKPVLTNGELEFNLSHCGTLAVLAVARSLPVGIDLERRRASIDLTKGIRDRCSEREGHAVLAAEDPHDEWARLWTRKEAVVKATGTGVLDQLAEVDVLEELVVADESVLGGAWRCLDLEPDPLLAGLHLALAMPAAASVTVVRRRI